MAGSIRRLESSLHWLGINFDEGPSIGGEHGPYYQVPLVSYFTSTSVDAISHYTIAFTTLIVPSKHPH